jgi:hypothetical protein
VPATSQVAAQLASPGVDVAERGDELHERHVAGLTDVVDPTAIGRYARIATGAKALVTPHG